MVKSAAYSGWIGKRNIGDEAIYLATQKLFPELQFTDLDYLSDHDSLILRGGTTLPKSISAMLSNTRS